MNDDLLFFLTLILLALCALGLSWFAGSDAPFVTTETILIAPILKKAGLKKGQVFYELGSGDGRVVLEAAKLRAKAYGVEQSWLRVWYSRLLAHKLRSKMKEVEVGFFHGNIFDRQYYPVDMVYLFLLPQGIEKLEKKLKKELRAGSIIITQTFHFKYWKPFKKIDLSQGKKVISKEGKKMGDFWIYRA